MSATDDLVERAKHYAQEFDKGGLPMEPAQHVAVVTCMDARINPYGIFGLTEGEVHVIRNGGGIVTDDVLHSLAISQRLLGTSEVVVVHHVDCGMRQTDHAAFHRAILDATGIYPSWKEVKFPDPESSVLASLDEIKNCPFLPHRGSVRGFVYDEESGALAEVV